MILVDSSVWIHLFRSPALSQTAAVGDRVGGEAATCGIILQEILQGLQPARYLDWARRSLRRHYYLDAPQSVYFKAAEYVRRCRAGGLQLTTVDALIAAIAASHGASLWTLDEGLLRAARLLSIRLHS